MSVHCINNTSDKKCIGSNFKNKLYTFGIVYLYDYSINVSFVKTKSVHIDLRHKIFVFQCKFTRYAKNYRYHTLNLYITVTEASPVRFKVHPEMNCRPP